MRAISSLRDIKMRVLVLSAIIACVYAAPSHYAVFPFAPVPYAVPVAVAPTIPPGDIQAADINARVKAADDAQYLADQAREQAELAAENQFEGIVEANDLVKEKSEEAFWAAEEKRWQAVNNVQTAEAKIDGSVANNVDAIAKGYPVAGVVGIPATGVIGVETFPPKAEGVIAKAVPEVAPIESSESVPPKPEAKAVPESAPIESNSANEKAVTIEAAESGEKQSADVKSANIEEKSEVKSAEIEKPVVESEKKEEVPDLQSAISEALKAQNVALENLKSSVFPAPAAVAPSYNYQTITPLSYQAAFRGYPVAAFQPTFGHVYPTLIKNVW